jgi:hypothetical protein
MSYHPSLQSFNPGPLSREAAHELTQLLRWVRYLSALTVERPLEKAPGAGNDTLRIGALGEMPGPVTFPGPVTLGNPTSPEPTTIYTPAYPFPTPIELTAVPPPTCYPYPTGGSSLVTVSNPDTSTLRTLPGLEWSPSETPAPGQMATIVNLGPGPVAILTSEGPAADPCQVVLQGGLPIGLPPGGSLGLAWNPTLNGWVPTQSGLGAVVAPSPTPVTLTGTPTVLPTGGASLVQVINPFPGSLITIPGFSGGYPGGIVGILNLGPGPIVIPSLSVLAPAGSQVVLPGGGVLVIPPGGTGQFAWNPTLGAWQPLSPFPGAAGGGGSAGSAAGSSGCMWVLCGEVTVSASAESSVISPAASAGSRIIVANSLGAGQVFRLDVRGTSTSAPTFKLMAGGDTVLAEIEATGSGDWRVQALVTCRNVVAGVAKMMAKCSLAQFESTFTFGGEDVVVDLDATRENELDLVANPGDVVTAYQGVLERLSAAGMSNPLDPSGSSGGTGGSYSDLTIILLGTDAAESSTATALWEMDSTDEVDEGD